MGEQPIRDGEPNLLRFGAYILDCGKRALTDGESRLPLSGKPLDLLILLLHRKGQIVSREDLRKEVWGGLEVSPGAIEQTIHRVRSVIRDNREQPDFIETVQGGTPYHLSMIFLIT